MDIIEDDSDLGSFFLATRSPYHEIDRWIHDWQLHQKQMGQVQWFTINSLQVYLRLQRRPSEGVRIEIASVENEVKGRGDFTRFLDWIEEAAIFHNVSVLRVENVLNSRFADYLGRKGFVQETIQTELPCLIKRLR